MSNSYRSVPRRLSRPSSSPTSSTETRRRPSEGRNSVSDVKPSRERITEPRSSAVATDGTCTSRPTMKSLLAKSFPRHAEFRKLGSAAPDDGKINENVGAYDCAFKGGQLCLTVDTIARNEHQRSKMCLLAPRRCRVSLERCVEASFLNCGNVSVT